MSVRRLAESPVQPASFAFNSENAEWAKLAVRKFPEGRQQSAVIPLLMRAQDQEGWVTKAAIETVATMLSMPYIRALEVATFYTQFQLKPVGTRAHVQVCGTTPCMLRGAEALMDVCRARIHPDQFHLNPAGTLSWEEVECLGACVNAPMVMVFKDTYEDLTPERLGEIIINLDAGLAVTPGPQNGRIYSAPEGGLTTLKDEKPLLKATRESQAEAGPPRAEPSGADGPVAPSNAAKPRTGAVETDPTLISPSPQKAAPGAEDPSGRVMPAYNKEAANQAEPAVEASDKQRRSKPLDPEVSPQKAPELLRGRPIGPTGQRADTDPKVAPEGVRSPEGGNMTPEGSPSAVTQGQPGKDEGEA